MCVRVCIFIYIHIYSVYSSFLHSKLYKYSLKDIILIAINRGEIWIKKFMATSVLLDIKLPNMFYIFWTYSKSVWVWKIFIWDTYPHTTYSSKVIGLHWIHYLKSIEIWIYNNTTASVAFTLLCYCLFIHLLIW